MSPGKSRTIALSAGVLVFALAGLIAFLAYEQFSGPGTRTRQVRVSDGAGNSSLPDMNNPKWQADFEAVYALKPGEVLKRIAPPFIPARQAFYLKTFGPGQYNAIPRGPAVMILGWSEKGGLPRMRGAAFGGAGLGYIFASILKIQSWDIQPNTILQMGQPMPGDWLVRQDADPAQLRTALLAELSRAVHATLTMEQKPIEREVIVVSGTFSPHPLTTQPVGRRPVVLFYRGTPVKPEQWFYGGSDLIDVLAGFCQRPVIFEGTARPMNIELRMDRNVYGLEAPPGSPQEARQTDELLANLAKQTSLSFTRQKRTMPTWILTRVSANSNAR